MAWTNRGKAAIFDGDSLNLAKILLDLAMISPSLTKISPYMIRMALFWSKMKLESKLKLDFRHGNPTLIQDS